MSYSYHAYGLNCLSNLAISAFSPSDNTEANALDITLDVGTEAPRWVRSARHLTPSIRPPEMGQADGPTHTVTTFGADEFFELAYDDGTRFVIDRDAKRVWGTCPSPLTSDHLAVYLRGPVMGFVLRRHGVTALHASAICIDGHAVVFCGPSEAGKSTVAAALALRGAPALCDDITAIKAINNEFHAESGYARICLWPDAVGDLFGTPDALPRLMPNWEKCFLPLDGSMAKFESAPRRIGAVYLLAPRAAESNAPRIEHLTAREALLELVKNTYMNWLLDRRHRGAEFDVLSQMVVQVPVRRIVPHHDPARIGALCDLVTRDVASLIARPAFTAVTTS